MKTERTFRLQVPDVTPSLFHPDCDEFSVYGNDLAQGRVKRWARDNGYYMVDDIASCAHGFLSMASCPGHCQEYKWFDHVSFWAPTWELSPFLLVQPYGEGLDTAELSGYADAHGLILSQRPDDNWHGSGTVAFRFSIAEESQTTWPLEKDIAVILRLKGVIS